MHLGANHARTNNGTQRPLACAVVLVYLGACAPVTQTAAREKEAESWSYRHAQKYLRQNRLSEARKELAAAYAFGRRPEYLLDLGAVYFRLGQTEQARVVLGWGISNTAAIDQKMAAETLAARVSAMAQRDVRCDDAKRREIQDRSRLLFEAKFYGKVAEESVLGYQLCKLPKFLMSAAGAYRHDNRDEESLFYYLRYTEVVPDRAAPSEEAAVKFELSLRNEAEANIRVLKQTLLPQHSPRFYERLWFWSIVVSSTVAAALIGGLSGGLSRPQAPQPWVNNIAL